MLPEASKVQPFGHRNEVGYCANHCSPALAGRRSLDSEAKFVGEDPTAISEGSLPPNVSSNSQLVTDDFHVVVDCVERALLIVPRWWFAIVGMCV